MRITVMVLTAIVAAGSLEAQAPSQGSDTIPVRIAPKPTSKLSAQAAAAVSGDSLKGIVKPVAKLAADSKATAAAAPVVVDKPAQKTQQGNVVDGATLAPVPKPVKP